MALTTQQEIEMAENKYAQVLRWIADGDSIQFQTADGTWVPKHWKAILEEVIVCVVAPELYRVEPRMLNIAGRDIESPLTVIAHNQEVWMCDATGSAVSIRYVSMPHFDSLRDSGRLFATQSAARAAYLAVTDLLTGKDAA